MNGPTDLTVRYRSPTIAINPLGWIKHKYPQTAQVITKRFFKSFEQTQRTVSALASINLLKKVHYPLSLNQIFLYMIEERMQVLLKNHPDSKQIEEEWHAVQILMAVNSENIFKIDVKSKLNAFIDNLCIKLIEIDVDPSKFKENILKITSIFSNSHIGEVPLSSFFEKALQNRSTEFELVSIPASSVHQCLELIIHNTKFCLVWLKPYVEEQISRISGALNSDIDLGALDSLHTFGTYIFLATKCQELPPLLLSIESMIKHLENFITSSEDSKKHELERIDILMLCRSIDDALPNLDINESEFTLSSHKSLARLPSLIDDYKHIRFCIQTLIRTPFARIDQLITCFKEAKVALGALSLNNTDLRAYLTTQLPIALPASKASTDRPTVNRTVTGHARPNNRSSKKGKGKAKPRQAREKELERSKGKEKCTSSFHDPVIEPKTEALETSVIELDQFQQESLNLITVAMQRKAKEAERACLINASWHLDKLSFAKRMLKEGLMPEERLDVLTAIAIHASLSLEQLYCYHLHKKRTLQHRGEDATLRIHHLKFLHRAAFGNNQFSPAINRLYLALYWTRFFHKEYHDWQRYLTFQRGQIPELLETLVCLSENPETFSESSFQKYCSEILDEVASVLPTLTNGQGSSSNKAVKALAEEPVKLELKTCRPVLVKMQKLAARISLSSYDSIPGLMIAQSLDSIKMLEHVLQRLHESSSSNEFCFFAYRALFLIQESAERSLHALDYIKRGYTDTEEHEIEKLCELVGLHLPELSSALSSASFKLKYPYGSDSKSSSAQLIDETISLTLHPELERGFEVSESAFSFWKLPLKDVNRKGIDASLQQILEIWMHAFEEAILPAFE